MGGTLVVHRKEWQKTPEHVEKNVKNVELEVRLFISWLRGPGKILSDPRLPFFICKGKLTVTIF